ncbi:MAG: RnfABCDGE type electron transport complex subunit G [Eubacteriales bacterium]|nr:RnfABCDGE type electron transport complex subunit G [Eubacteriales bacterium]
MDSSKKGGGIGMLVVVLGLITFVCALLLGLINGVTKDKIAQNGIATRNAAMGEIIPDAEFTDVEIPADFATPADKNQPVVSGVYQATVAGQPAGYCVEVNPKGFGGALKLIVGIGADGTVAGAKVTEHGETPGLGAKAQSDQNWIAQYAGQPADGSLKVTKDGGTINAITGATITSRAVTLGVDTAANCIAALG